MKKKFKCSLSKMFTFQISLLSNKQDREARTFLTCNQNHKITKERVTKMWRVLASVPIWEVISDSLYFCHPYRWSTVSAAKQPAGGTTWGMAPPVAPTSRFQVLALCLDQLFQVGESTEDKANYFHPKKKEPKNILCKQLISSAKK